MTRGEILALPHIGERYARQLCYLRFCIMPTLPAQYAAVIGCVSTWLMVNVAMTSQTLYDPFSPFILDTVILNT